MHARWNASCVASFMYHTVHVFFVQMSLMVRESCCRQILHVDESTSCDECNLRIANKCVTIVDILGMKK